MVTPVTFKKWRGIEVGEKPYPNCYVLAEASGNPAIFAKLVYSSGFEKSFWIITTGNPYDSFMFKDSGLFGHTDDKLDAYRNGYENLDEAIEAFHKFYK